MTTTRTTIATADILDELCAVVDTARITAAAHPAWLRAIDTAWNYLLQTDELHYDDATHTLYVASATTAGVEYAANGACQCRAYTHGAGVCWHRAAAKLVRRALALQLVTA